MIHTSKFGTIKVLIWKKPYIFLNYCGIIFIVVIFHRITILHDFMSLLNYEVIYIYIIYMYFVKKKPCQSMKLDYTNWTGLKVHCSKKIFINWFVYWSYLYYPPYIYIWYVKCKLCIFFLTSSSVDRHTLIFFF